MCVLSWWLQVECVFTIAGWSWWHRLCGLSLTLYCLSTSPTVCCQVTDVLSSSSSMHRLLQSLAVNLSTVSLDGFYLAVCTIVYFIILHDFVSSYSYMPLLAATALGEFFCIYITVCISNSSHVLHLSCAIMCYRHSCICKSCSLLKFTNLVHFISFIRMDFCSLDFEWCNGGKL